MNTQQLIENFELNHAVIYGTDYTQVINTIKPSNNETLSVY